MPGGQESYRSKTVNGVDDPTVKRIIPTIQSLWKWCGCALPTTL